MFRLPGPLSGLVPVRTTLPTRNAAEALATRLVDGRLAACTHITELASVYRWKGARLQETEYAVEARTTLRNRSRVVEAMQEGHPYEVPLVESWPVSHVPRAYARWAAEQLD